MEDSILRLLLRVATRGRRPISEVKLCGQISCPNNLPRDTCQQILRRASMQIGINSSFPTAMELSTRDT